MPQIAKALPCGCVAGNGIGKCSIPIPWLQMRLLLADDHNLLRDTLAAFIEHNEPNSEVVMVNSLVAALEAAQCGEWDIIILDYIMPGMGSGKDKLRGYTRIKEIVPDTPVAILSGEATAEDVDDMVEAGVAGFLPKTMGAASLLAAIRLIAKGERVVNNKHDPLTVLTERERQVAALMAEEKRNGEIAELLEMAVVTVKLHVRSILKKLKCADRKSAINLYRRIEAERAGD